MDFLAPTTLDYSNSTVLKIVVGINSMKTYKILKLGTEVERFHFKAVAGQSRIILLLWVLVQTYETNFTAEEILKEYCLPSNNGYHFSQEEKKKTRVF